MRTLAKKLFKLNLRCFFLQACWNFHVFQGVGSAWITQPFRKEGPTTSAKSDASSQRYPAKHIAYFNTNTFCAPAVLAAQLALYEKQARGEYVVIGADEFTAAVMAPVAAVGDALFWGGLRPLAALVAIVFVFQGFLWAPLVVIGLFALPTLIVRIAGSVLGYKRDAQVVALIQQLHLANVAVKIKQINMVFLGVIAAFAWRGLDAELDLVSSHSFSLAALVLLFVGVNVLLLRRNVPVVVVLGVTVVLCCTAACIM